MSAEQIHDTLERLCALMRVDVRASGAEDGLLPVQLEALHYLSQCNRYSDTVQGLTDFLGQTKGTVSQTVKVLTARGLVEKLPDSEDRRIVHLHVTAAGRQVLTKLIPAHFLAEGLRVLPEAEITRLSQALTELLRTVQYANRFKTFAVCKSCRFNEGEGGSCRCELTGEALSETDVELICREHQSRKA